MSDKRTPLRDKYGQTIGDIYESADGSKIIRDRAGNTLGKYDAKTNTTHPFGGPTMGTGDQTTRLL